MDYKIGQEVFFIDTSYMHKHWHSLCVKHGKITMDTSMGIDTIEDDEGLKYYDVLNSNVFPDYESALAEFQKKYDGQKRICNMTDLEWSIYEIEKVLNRWKKYYDVSDDLYNDVEQWLLSDPHVEDLEARVFYGAIQYRYDPCEWGGTSPDIRKDWIENHKGDVSYIHRSGGVPLNMKYWPQRHPIDVNCPGWKNGWQNVPGCEVEMKEEYFLPPKNHIKRWDKDTFERYDKTRGSYRHLQEVEAYIYQMNGNYNIHRYYTPIGFTAYIADDGKILAGDMDVKQSGKMYNINLINMYGRLSLQIIRIGNNAVYGWSNKDANSGYSISTQCKELSREVIEQILSNLECRFDDVSTRFMDLIKQVYENDKSNYFCI